VAGTDPPAPNPPDREIVFAVDGSPDRCAAILATQVPATGWRARIV
jgi:hypothetical protein